jgi:hypothetical protein
MTSPGGKKKLCKTILFEVKSGLRRVFNSSCVINANFVNNSAHYFEYERKGNMALLHGSLKSKFLRLEVIHNQSFPQPYGFKVFWINFIQARILVFLTDSAEMLITQRCSWCWQPK